MDTRSLIWGISVCLSGGFLTHLPMRIGWPRARGALATVVDGALSISSGESGELDEELFLR